MRPAHLAAALFLALALPAGAMAQTSPAAAPSAASRHGSHAATKAELAASMAPVNVNAASTDDLRKLPGIGKGRAASIVAHRPYDAPEDLVAKKAISQSLFDRIKDKVVTH